MLFRRSIQFLLLSLFIQGATAASSKGTDFWFAFPRGSYLATNDSATISFVITGTPGTTGSITSPILNGSTTSSFTLDTNGYAQFSRSFSAPSTSDPDVYQTKGNDEIGSRSFHVTAAASISIQPYFDALPYTIPQASVASWQAIPTDALGNEYFVLAYGNPSTASSTEGTEFVIVGTVNGTKVTITPSVAVGSRAAGVAYQITLDQGQTYRAATGAANADLTGTLISATQNIAVIAGHTCARIPTSTSICSTVLEQLFPTSGWARRFILSPLAGLLAGTNGDRVRFIANSDGTVVTVNNTSVPLNRGQWYETSLNSSTGSNPPPLSTLITSNFPIMVAQYMKDQSDYLPSNAFEPSMLMVPGYDHYLTSMTFNLPTNGFRLYANLVVPTSLVGSVTLDGTIISAINSGYISSVGSTGYSQAILPITPTGGTPTGNHTILGPLPFGAMIYGQPTSNSGPYRGFGSIAGFNMPTIPRASTVTVTPASGKFQLNTRNCFTATLLTSSGLPVPDASVTFVVSGVDSGTQYASTDSSGSTTLCYTGTQLGTDTLIVKASASSVESSPVTIQWIQTNLEQLILTVNSIPVSTSPVIGDTVCVKSTLKDNLGAPISGTIVNFSVTGANPGTGQATSDKNGAIEYCYQGKNLGADTVAASVTFSNGDKISQDITFSWQSAVSSIALSGSVSETKVGNRVCVSANALDAQGKGVSNIAIDFVVSGAETLTGTSLTGSSGIAEYCYIPGSAGVDSISATTGSVSSESAVKVTVASNPSCDVVSASSKSSLTHDLLSSCLVSYAKNPDQSAYDECQSQAKASFVTLIQASNTSAGCLASNGTEAKADQLVSYLLPVLSPILNEEISSLKVLGQAKGLRRFGTIATQISKTMDACLSSGGAFNQPKVTDTFESLFALSGNSVLSVNPRAYVQFMRDACSSILSF